jgi:thioredoxin-disulfide reductase
MIYELAVIGAGPGGLTAALYGARQGLKTVVIATREGGQLLKTPLMENYPGFDKISGEELVKKIEKQVKKYPVNFIWQEAKEIKKSKETFQIKIADSQTIKSKTVILAFGKKPRKLNIPGEKRLTGRGVSYCAICDMPFFTGKRVAIIGGGNSAIHAVLTAERIAQKIYLIHRRDKFRAEKALLKNLDRIKKKGKLKIVTFSEVIELLGKEKLEKIRLINNQTKKERVIPVAGVFFEIGSLINTKLVKNLVDFNQQEELKTNLKGETKTPGLFVAGDLNAETSDQAIIAAGQGANAALGAYQYLKGTEGEKL